MHLPPEFFELPADMVHVLCLNVAEYANELEGGVNALDSAEQERAMRYINPWHGRRYAYSRGLLRRVLGHFLGQAPATIRFTYGAYGRPELKEAGGLSFNLSHSGDWVALGVSHGRRVGIDLANQTDCQDCLSVARQCFSSRELAGLERAMDIAHDFCVTWVRKEAALKAAGLGLDAMQTFCTHNPAVALPDECGSRVDWYLSDIPMPHDYHLALAVEGELVRNRCFRL